MKGKTAAILSIILIVSALGGCWSYRSLDDLSIITGMAVDLNDTGGYEVTYEAVDHNVPIKQQGVKSILIESQGATLFDAARNAKKRNENELYFGHMQIVIISEEVARSKDISGIIDWFLRDIECRETLNIIVSLGQPAKDVLYVEEAGTPLTGLELQKIAENDCRNTLSVPYVELYNVFNITKTQGVSLALPVFHIADSGGQRAAESYGTAVYKGERMAGTLSAEETKYFLFTQGRVLGGVLTFSSSGQGADDAALRISKNRTDKSYTFENGRLKIQVKTETDVFLEEYSQSTDDINAGEIDKLESAAAACLARRIGDVIKKVQTEYASDIFGFGEMIHQQNAGFWKQIKDNWDGTFASLDVGVQCKINIINTASIKE